MNTRERFHAVMNFQEFDRLPILEWASWWKDTIDRWNNEGMPIKKSDPESTMEIMRYFDMDIYYQGWLRSRGVDTPRPASHGAGIMKTPEDYENIRKYLHPEMPFNRESWEKWAKIQEKGDVVLWFSLDGFFWFPRALFGIEAHLFSFYDQPELYHRINSELAEFHLRAIDQLCEICTPDFMTFAEDMSYNNGPMISKELFDEFMKPYYLKVVPELKKRGIRVFIDSDGDITQPAAWFEEVGIEGILPIEKQAGTDLVELRKKHPDQLYIGAFDKMVMNKGEEAIRNEFERLLPVARQGGFIISCDHQTPPGVSLDDYRLYLKIWREYAELAAKASSGQE